MPNKLSSKNGVIIVASLWILVTISILAVCISYRASIGLKLVKYYRDEIAANSAAKIAVNNFIETLKQDNPKPLKDIKVGDVTFSIEVIDEQGKLSLNSSFVDDNVLSKFSFLSRGLRDEMLKYKQSKYGSKIDNLEELCLLKNFDPEIAASLNENFTVYGDGCLNIKTAKPEILEAVGIKKDLIDKIVSARTNNKDIDLKESGLVEFGNRLATSSNCYRLNIVSKAGKVNKKTKVVLTITGSNYAAEYWNES